MFRKTCDTCKYSANDCNDEPCFSCDYSNDNWELSEDIDVEYLGYVGRNTDYGRE